MAPWLKQVVQALINVSQADKDFGASSQTYENVNHDTRQAPSIETIRPYGTFPNANAEASMQTPPPERLRPGAKAKMASVNIFRRSASLTKFAPRSHRTHNTVLEDGIFQDPQSFEEVYAQEHKEKEALEKSLADERAAAKAREDKLAQTTAALARLEDAAMSRERELEAAVAKLQSLARRREEERRGALLQLSDAATREDDLQKTLTVHRQQLALATTDLKHLRAFTGDNADAQVLLSLFDDLNDAVSELAFRLVDNLSVSEAAVEQWHVSAIDGINSNGGSLDYIVPFLRHCVSVACPTEFALVSLFQAVFHSLLDGMIFRPFMPIQRMEADTYNSNFLQYLLELVRAQEPQEYSARWRTMTYKALNRGRDDATLAYDLIRVVFGALHEVVAALAPSSAAPFSAQFTRFHTDAVLIVRKALDWQDKACGGYCEFDYATFFPAPGVAYVDSDMHLQDLPVPSVPAGPSSSIALATCMGLRAARTVVDPTTGASRSDRVLKKAHVIISGARVT